MGRFWVYLLERRDSSLRIHKDLKESQEAYRIEHAADFLVRIEKFDMLLETTVTFVSHSMDGCPTFFEVGTVFAAEYSGGPV